MAIQQFEAGLKLKVVPTGIWLHPSGVLGASPDGLVEEDAIVEVKCPYSFRNERLLDKLKNNKTYIISIKNEDIIVNKNHEYYAQIQGILHITNRQKCYLVIWTPQDTFVVVIEKEEAWNSSLIKLEQFYYDIYLKKVIQ